MITLNRRKKVLGAALLCGAAALVGVSKRTMRAESILEESGNREPSGSRRIWAQLKKSALGGRAGGESFSNGAVDAMAISPASAPAAAPQRMQSAVDKKILSAQDRKIVRNATISLEAKAFPETRKRLLEAAARFGAEIQSDSTASGGADSSGTIVLRVAPDKLDALLSQLDGLGRIQERTVSETNMGEEYVDLGARLTNLRRVEKRLNDLLAFQTHRLGDILQVEHELERVGAEIEQIEGRRTYIDRLAASSIVTVSLSEPAKETSEAHGVAYAVRNALVRCANTFIATGLTLLNLSCFLLAVGVWTLPAAGAVWFYRKRIGEWLNAA